MREKSRLVLVASVVSALLVLLAPAGAQAFGNADSPEVTSAFVGGNPDAVRAYWTANNGRNMIEAKELTLARFTPVLKQRAVPAGAPTEPTFVMSGSTGGRFRAMVRSTTPQKSAASFEPMAGVFPFSFTRYRLFPNTEAEYKTYPYRTVGKLFFNIGTSRFVCSASVVTSFNTSVVWTAGHCVFSPDLGVFHTNFLFVPAQRRVGLTPTSPYGDWTAFTAVILTLWTQGFLEYDHGVLVMNRNTTTGQTVGETVGMLGFMANAPRLQNWHLHGYPQGAHAPPSVDPQFTGFHHEICAATWATNDQPTGKPGVDPPTIGVGCDLTGGSSGGPWIVDLNSLAVSASGGAPVALNLLNGNNSYRYTGPAPNSQRLYGPYFGPGANVLRQFAENIDIP